MHAIIRKTVTAASLIALAGHGLANGIEAAPELERVPKACQTADRHDSFVLAVSWQPGFCEYKAGSAAQDKPECVAMAQGDLVVHNLTLHGLWPNRKSCGTQYGNCRSTPLKLSAATIERVRPWMPNFYYGTEFGSYEWKKHGSCQTALDDDAYFRKAVAAVELLNDSEVGRTVRRSVGRSFQRQDLIAAFESIQPQAGNSVTLLCSGRQLYEMRVKLPRDFRVDKGLKGLIGKRPQPMGQRHECPDGPIEVEASGMPTVH